MDVNMRIFKNTSFSLLSALGLLLLLSGCTTQESHRIVETQKVESFGSSYEGPKSPIVVGKFENRSNYMQGLFSVNTDRLGNQAKTILKSHLQQTNRFKVVDRENLEGNQQEAVFSGSRQNITGARYTVSGAVSEFGRKTTGDHQLFGIVGSGKKQTAYAKVTLNIVDVLSSEIVHSIQGGGEYTLNNREVLGFGSTAAYDATLNGKVLNLAITEAVNILVRDLERGAWGKAN